MAQTNWVYRANIRRVTLRTVVLVSNEELTQAEAWQQLAEIHAGDIDEDTIDFEVRRPTLIDCPPDAAEEEE